MAFHTRYKLFKYLIILFGLINAPTSEQELINNIFKDILDKYIIIYLDNILVYSAKALDNHIGKVYEVFRRFNKRNLKLKSKKYRFHQEEVEFLGYIVGRDKIYINPQKIASIKEWPKPANIIKV